MILHQQTGNFFSNLSASNIKKPLLRILLVREAFCLLVCPSELFQLSSIHYDKSLLSQETLVLLGNLPVLQNIFRIVACSYVARPEPLCDSKLEVLDRIFLCSKLVSVQNASARLFFPLKESLDAAGDV